MLGRSKELEDEKVPAVGTFLEWRSSEWSWTSAWVSSSIKTYTVLKARPYKFYFLKYILYAFLFTIVWLHNMFKVAHLIDEFLKILETKEPVSFEVRRVWEVVWERRGCWGVGEGWRWGRALGIENSTTNFWLPYQDVWQGASRRTTLFLVSLAGKLAQERS